jgi:hypothetical protein
MIPEPQLGSIGKVHNVMYVTSGSEFATVMSCGDSNNTMIKFQRNMQLRFAIFWRAFANALINILLSTKWLQFHDDIRVD